MSRLWKPEPIEVYKEWVESIIVEAQDKLSEWENNFVESIQTRLMNGWNLTENQANKLEQIYADKIK